MVLHKCKCGYETHNKNDFTRHLNKKFPCVEAPFKCKKCERPYYSRSALYGHQRYCEGKVEEEDNELQQRIETLEAEIERLSSGSASVSTQSKIRPAGFGKLEDSIYPQTYFGIPGQLLQPDEPTDTETLIKFGSTKDPSKRIPKHHKDFGGFRLLDSIVSDNPIEVEDKLKDWLKINNKLVKAKSVNKTTTDTELFYVKDQAEYEMIVKVAKTYGDHQMNRINEQFAHRMELEKQILQGEKQILLAQREVLKYSLEKNENS